MVESVNDEEFMLTVVAQSYHDGFACGRRGG